jgi:hypothetical protein
MSMNATRNFTIVIVKTPGGHKAFAPGFHHVAGEGKGRAAAYKEFKRRLAEYLRRRLSVGAAIPNDKTVAVKNVRINLRTLAREEELT